MRPRPLPSILQVDWGLGRPAGVLGSDAASGWTGPGDLARSVTSSEPGAVESGVLAPFHSGGAAPRDTSLPWPGLGGAAWTQGVWPGLVAGAAVSPQRAQALQVRLVLPTWTPGAGSAQCRSGGMWNKDV